MKRDEEFWFDDGSVVLVARGAVEFKVYRRVLSRCSVVFADMFSIPQPASAVADGQTGNDCPVVHLDDSAHDLRYFLRALFPDLHETFFITQAEAMAPPTFHMVSACARLGHKYQIDHIVDQCCAYLRGHFAVPFVVWRMRNQLVPPLFEPIHAIGIVNIARLLHDDSILPTALLVCCTLDVPELIHGFRHEDGSEETLSEADLYRCIQGKVALTQETSTTVFRVFGPPPPNPQDPLGFRHQWCHEPIFQHLSDLSAERPGLVAGPYPFSTWGDYYSDRPGPHLICNGCTKTIKEKLNAEQAQIWQDLPTLVDIDVAWPQPTPLPQAGQVGSH